MRYGEGHKEAVRARIIAAAARALRTHGIAGVSIPALMKLAGLTHGGFYAHFADRDELVCAAVAAGAQETAERVLDGGRDAALAAYLSPEHVAHPEAGCVLAALGAEAPRQPEPVRRAFARAARGFLDRVQKMLSPRRGGPGDEALALASKMVGAVVLARIVDDEKLAARILAAARR